MFDPMLARIYKAPSFDDPYFARDGMTSREQQYRELVESMWEMLTEEQRHATYYAFMGDHYDSEEG